VVVGDDGGLRRKQELSKQKKRKEREKKYQKNINK
jgi:hypothetical protein